MVVALSITCLAKVRLLVLDVQLLVVGMFQNVPTTIDSPFWTCWLDAFSWTVWLQVATRGREALDADVTDWSMDVDPRYPDGWFADP